MKNFLVILLMATVTLAQTAIAKDKEPRVVTEQAQIRVNINTASAEQLAANLTGIGLKKAQAIVDYRNEYGDFKSANELTAVKGIGDKTLAKNREKIGL